MLIVHACRVCRAKVFSSVLDPGIRPYLRSVPSAEHGASAITNAPRLPALFTVVESWIFTPTAGRLDQDRASIASSEPYDTIGGIPLSTPLLLIAFVIDIAAAALAGGYGAVAISTLLVHTKRTRVSK
ncbi:hypothetical protein ACW2Q0_20290 [Nocardia sp. R16R-3T]